MAVAVEVPRKEEATETSFTVDATQTLLQAIPKGMEGQIRSSDEEADLAAAEDRLLTEHNQAEDVHDLADYHAEEMLPSQERPDDND